MSERDRTPLAVALQYEAGGVPRVTAKGRGAVAEAILRSAQDSGVAIEENAALAEALSAIDLDAEIPEALYRAVAEVLSFVLRSAAQGSLR